MRPGGRGREDTEEGLPQTPKEGDTGALPSLVPCRRVLLSLWKIIRFGLGCKEDSV